MKTRIQNLPTALLLLVLSILQTRFQPLFAQDTTAFTYQGQLRDTGTNATGSYNMAFKLFETAAGTNQIGGTLTNSPFLVNGLFSVNLDFGASAFTGRARWVDITIQSGTNAQETLAPRVQVLPTPYALYAANAAFATNAAYAASAGGLSGLRVVSGVIGGDGTIYVGTGFTVSNTGTGKYRVLFVPAFSSTPVVTVSAVSGTPGDSGGFSVATIDFGNAFWDKTGFDAKVANLSLSGQTNSLVPSAWSFIAVGPP